ncbi:homeobox protein ceh-13-like [Bolinopsis microptera]|uniref:homeobox protein ceh-13-like n=1 Tax=Bolinopsis microptera TaxID=2820187 RepID=UPI00307AB916
MSNLDCATPIFVTPILTIPSSPLTPQPLKHSIESLLAPHKKRTPARPSARYRPYSLTPPPSPNRKESLTPLEHQLLLLKQMQQQIQFSEYISSLPTNLVRDQPHLTNLTLQPLSFSTPVTPSTRPVRKPRSAVVTQPSSTKPDSTPHVCTATTCNSPSCPHRITTPTSLSRRQTSLPRRQTQSADQIRTRTNLTSEQKGTLQLVFSETVYLTKSRRRLLSEETGLKEETISVWFQNRRRMEKKRSANIPRADVL